LEHVAGRDRSALLATTLFVLAASLGLSGCGGPNAGEERALARLERLIFVPPGVCSLGLGGLDCSNQEALLVDRYEVTRGEWRAHLDESPEQFSGPAEAIWGRWDADSGTLPATFMSQGEALDFAAQEGMRIPTQREWLRISAGTRAQPWPWGTSPARSVANTLDLGIPGALGVGTFEAGATPSGVYDLIGNVREWVTTEGAGASTNELAAAMGGSWLSHQEPLFDWDSTKGLRLAELEIDSRHRSIDLGLRLTATAEEYLKTAASSWGESPSSAERVRAVGERWGRPAEELLRRLSVEGDQGIGWLLEGAQR
jgi:hypothetical protein